jgi:hypothetical protein
LHIENREIEIFTRAQPFKPGKRFGRHGACPICWPNAIRRLVGLSSDEQAQIRQLRLG